MIPQNYSKTIAKEELTGISSRQADLPDSLKEYASLIEKEFSWRGYRSRNSDLAHLGKAELVDHFLACGIKEPRHWKPSAYLLDRRFALAARSGSNIHLRTNVQAVIHCYHYDVLCYFLPYLRQMARIGAKIMLLVANDNISDSVLDDFILRLYTGCAKHSWKRVENRGEDWSSFSDAYLLGYFNNPGLTIKLQTKKSLNLGADGGNAWIDEAIAPLCGNTLSILSILERAQLHTNFTAASQTVASEGFGFNPDLVTEFIRRLPIGEEHRYKNVPFAAGSMFVASNSLIRAFFSQLGEVNYNYISSKGSAYCGRFPGHALERLFFYYSSHLQQSGDCHVSWI